MNRDQQVRHLAVLLKLMAEEEGHRPATLWFCVHQLDTNDYPPKAYDALRDAARASGLTDYEITRVMDTGPTADGRQLVITPASDIQMRARRS